MPVGKQMKKGRAFLVGALRDLGIETYGGAANFVLARVGEGEYFFRELQKREQLFDP